MKLLKILFLYLLTVLVILFIIGCGGDSNPVTNTGFKNILILGNSITYQVPVPALGWNGAWGMAASTLEKDYAHLLKNHIGVDKNYIIDFVNYFEVDPASYDFSKADIYRSFKADLIIIKLGENVSGGNDDVFISKYEQLIDYVNNNNAKIVVVNSYWDRPLNAQIKSMAEKRNWVFIDISKLQLDPNNNATSFTDPSVAAHPGDAGMQKIADAIIRVL